MGCHAENYKAMCWQVLIGILTLLILQNITEISSEWLNGKLTKSKSATCIQSFNSFNVAIDIVESSLVGFTLTKPLAQKQLFLLFITQSRQA